MPLRWCCRRRHQRTLSDQGAAGSLAATCQAAAAAQPAAPAAAAGSDYLAALGRSAVHELEGALSGLADAAGPARRLSEGGAGRSIGTLTAWQLLAADVQAEMDGGRGGSQGSEAVALPLGASEEEAEAASLGGLAASEPSERLAPQTRLSGSAREQVNADGSLQKPPSRGPLAGLREKLGG